MFLSLTLICVVSASILATVNHLTIEPIEKAKKDKLDNSIRQVVPEFDNSPSEEFYYGKISTGDSLKIYPAKKNNMPVGYAVESHSMKGFSGEIKIIVGFDPKGKIINYEVLQHAETPGLGSKMNDWFKENKNKRSIIGKTISAKPLAVTKDGGDVDAITAATISSRAFLEAVNLAYEAYSGTTIDAKTSASTQNQ